MKIRNQARLS